MREPEGLKQTAMVSVAVHVVALTALAFLPGVLPAKSTPPPIVMTISLGGTPGPKTGGTTMLGGRTIQPAAPGEEPRVERVAMPEPQAAPAMVMPVPDARVRPRPTPTPRAPAATASRTTPARAGRGAEAQQGSTRVETGARGMGFGLSSGGGGGTGGYLDVQNFCCPEYLQDMIERVRRNWAQQQDSTGTVLMKFTVQRDGQITGVETERSSNFAALDLASQRALLLTGRLQPLPPAFPDNHLTIHMYFEYQRR